MALERFLTGLVEGIKVTSDDRTLDLTAFSVHRATEISLVENPTTDTFKTVTLYIKTTDVNGNPVQVEFAVYTNDLDLKVRQFKSYRSYLNPRKPRSSRKPWKEQMEDDRAAYNAERPRNLG